MKPIEKDAAATQVAMRTCAAVMAAAALGLLLVYGLTWWSMMSAAILLICPVLLVWLAFRYGRQDDAQQPKRGFKHGP